MLSILLIQLYYVWVLEKKKENEYDRKKTNNDITRVIFSEEMTGIKRKAKSFS